MIVDFLTDKKLTDEKSAVPVTACLLSLGSNYQAKNYLAELPHRFSHALAIKTLWFSEIILSPDNKPSADCPIYHNQMALLSFSSPMPYTALHQTTKQLETLAQRYAFNKPIVTLDVDIIAVEIEYQYWQTLARRLPLASYEQQGLQQLLQKVSVTKEHWHFLQSLLVNN